MLSMLNAGRGTLVHVGERECNEYCREQRAARARSQALSGTSSGISMNRAGSVLVLSSPSEAHFQYLPPWLPLLSMHATVVSCHLCI